MDVASLEVSLVLVETDMEGARTRSIDVPVRIDELRLVHLLGAVQFGRSTYQPL